MSNSNLKNFIDHDNNHITLLLQANYNYKITNFLIECINIWKNKTKINNYNEKIC